MMPEQQVLQSQRQVIDQYIKDNFVFSGEEEFKAGTVAGETTLTLPTFLMKPYVAKTININEGDALNLPYNNRAFNIIFAHYLLPHLDTEQQIRCIREMSRVTKNSGIIFPENGLYRKTSLPFPKRIRVSGFLYRGESLKEGILPLEEFDNPKSVFNIANYEKSDGLIEIIDHELLFTSPTLYRAFSS